MPNEKEDGATVPFLAKSNTRSFSKENWMPGDVPMYVNEAKFPVFHDMREAVMLLVRRVKGFRVDGNTVIFQTQGSFFQRGTVYRYLDSRAVFKELPHHRDICVTLTFCTDQIIRLQAKEGSSVPNRKTEMAIGNFNGPEKLDIVERKDHLAISTGKIRVIVAKNPWNMSVYHNEKLVFSQFGEDKRTVVNFEQCPFGFLYEGDEVYACDSVSMRNDEHFYGFGEKFMPLDKRGRNIKLWNTNASGVHTERAYKNIPFFMSTEGYGIFLNHSVKINCDMGSYFNKAYAMTVGDDYLDYYILSDPLMKNILGFYTDVTGKTPLPPRWSFGYWQSKKEYREQKQVEETAARMRAEQIPCDVIHINIDWTDEIWVCNWRFARDRFPDVPGMCKKLEKMGMKVSLWQYPYVEKGTRGPDVYEEGFEKGYFALPADGVLEFPHGLPDLSNPETLHWYKNKLIRPLLEMGIKCIKVDFGESAPPFYKYANVAGKEMHNLFPLLYNKAVFEVIEDVYGKGEAVIWARSTWAGSQRYPLHWAGDPGTDFASLSDTLKGGLSFGLSGFPFWSHDIGGFFFETNPELYIRWAQVGFFSSHSRIHGYGKREPWDFEEVKDIFVKYDRLKYVLMPYIHSQAKKCTENSWPMVRALVLEYQNDPNVYAIDTQYMFGDCFMVAPILTKDNRRRVYLPEGTWTDYWTCARLEGNRWIDVEAQLDTLPLYIRENAVIPMGPVMNYVDELPADPLTIDLYPVSGCYRTEICLKDHTLSVLLDAGKDIKLEISEVRQRTVLRFNNIKNTAMKVNGKEKQAGSAKRGAELVLEPMPGPIVVTVN